MVRSKAVKALRSVVQSSAATLMRPAVAEALSNALKVHFPLLETS